MGEILGVLLHHRGKVLHYNEIRLADGFDIAMIEPDGAVAESFNISGGVRNEQNSNSAGAQFMNLAHAALPEVNIADCECLVHQENLRIDVNCHGKCESDDHAA